MSGMTKIPLLCRISSAAAVVGPFAPSARILHLIRSAFCEVIWFSVAAGTSTSHSSSSSSSLVMNSTPGNSSNERVCCRCAQRRVDVYPVRVVDAAVDVRDGDDLVAGLVHQARRRCRRRCPSPGRRRCVWPRRHAEPLDGLVDDEQEAAAGRLAPARGAAEVNGLAGDDGRHGVARVHRVGVHDPGHRLLVGVHVGRGHVLLGADEVDELGRVAARHALQLAHATSASGRR